MKRIALFLLTNLGVMLVLGLVVNVLGLNRFLSAFVSATSWSRSGTGARWWPG